MLVNRSSNHGMLVGISLIALSLMILPAHAFADAETDSVSQDTGQRYYHHMSRTPASTRHHKSKSHHSSASQKTAAVSPSCRTSNAAKVTQYFVPQQSDYCSGGSICQKFKKEVAMQGTGKLNNGKVLKYSDLGRRKGQYLEDGCKTAVGAAGCLMPFLSVAADFRKYPAGTIIRIPALEGRYIQIPGVGIRRHPGYVIVQDQGSAIKGTGRFDLFAGSLAPDHPNNALGYKSAEFADRIAAKTGAPDQGGLTMTSKNLCESTFSVIRYGSAQWKDAYAQIESTAGHEVDFSLAGNSSQMRGNR